MKYIKLFENFDESNWENVKQNIDDIFIELVDLGFKVDISTGYNYTNVSVNIEVPDNSKYNISMVKDYILMFVDYMKHTWSEFYVYANYEYKLNVWMKRNNWKPNGFSKIYYKNSSRLDFNQDWDNPNWQSFKIEGLKCIVTQAKYN